MELVSLNGQFQWVYFYYIVDITVAPLSVSVPLYTPANFTCEGTGVILSWTVGSNLLTDPSNQDRKISVTTNNISVNVWSSVLTIRALPINDGISIECNLISFIPYGLKQKGATLTIKGMSSVVSFLDQAGTVKNGPILLVLNMYFFRYIICWGFSNVDRE